VVFQWRGGAVARAAGRSNQAVTVQRGMDGALSGDTHVAG